MSLLLNYVNYYSSRHYYRHLSRYTEGYLKEHDQDPVAKLWNGISSLLEGGMLKIFVILYHTIS